VKITYPHMGLLTIALAGFFQDIGLEVVPPPPITKKTVNLGVLHSPEFACLPLKINVGNFIEALETGADTIIMAGGTGPCRFGCYAQVQREILRDLGYRFEMIILEPPQGNWQGLFRQLKRLRGNCSPKMLALAGLNLWRKLKAMERLHKKSLKVRAREINKGDTTKAYNKGLAMLAEIKDPQAIPQVLRDGLGLLEEIPKDSNSQPLRIGLVGEIYTLLEPFANLRIEELLGDRGVEAECSAYISDWIIEHLVLNSLRLPAGLAVKKAAAPYLNCFVGGHGRETVGDTVRYARRGFDGVIHVLPFTCTPEIVAQSILPVVSRREGIPFLSVSLDEQSGEAGLITRLEAFLDLLSEKKKKNFQLSRKKSLFGKIGSNAGKWR
jgi:predicted nucleotide-binding protein (sugar kinase/HSP70/actin superfamily)